MRLRLLFVIAALLISGAAHAMDFGFSQPKVDYSATQTMEAEGATLVSKVYSSGQKQRSEMDMGGMEMVTITRLDKKVIWQLMPMQETYMETSFAEAKAGKGDDFAIVEQTEVGRENLNGFATTKTKTVIKDKKGNKFAGFTWTTDNGITVKMDAISVDENKNKARIKMELTDIKVGKVDPALFEIPKGYQKMSGMGGMMGSGMMEDMEEPGMHERPKKKQRQETQEKQEKKIDKETLKGFLPGKLKNLPF